MKSEVIRLRYDGPDLADHKMDVSLLAPALMALGDLVRQANSELNHGEAEAKVLINADLDANCITINLDVIVGWLGQFAALVQHSNVRTAKELLEWLGILGVPTGLGLLAYLKSKGGKDVESRTEIKDSNGNTTVQIKFVGDNNRVEISPEVEKLASNPKVVAATKGIVKPVRSSEGITCATFSDESGAEVKIDKEYADQLWSVASSPMPPDEEDISQIVGHIVVHSPVLDENADKWKFKYNDRVEKIDISDSTIAETIMRRGKVVVGDTFKVRMDVWEVPQGRGYRNEYKVVEVLEFKPGAEQPNLLPE